MDGHVSGQSWKAGAAAVAITPTEPMWLAGWAIRREPAASAAMPLKAKALAIEDPEGERLVIVTADLIAIQRSLAESVASLVHAQLGLPRHCILFNASHTHNGPEVRADKAPFFEIPDEFVARMAPYVEGLTLQLAALVKNAVAKLQPAVVRSHRGEIDFAKNRRSSNGPVDHEIPILAFSDLQDRPIAIVFGYACHNLALPPEFLQFHGDYAGIAQHELEARYRGAIAMFLSGAGADQDPAPRGSVELTTYHGRQLAAKVVDALAGAGDRIEGSLAVAFEEIALPLQPISSTEQLKNDASSEDNPRARKARYLLDRLQRGESLPVTLTCPIQTIRFGGDLIMIALGGEPVVDYSLLFKARFTDASVWVAGYANDMFGYLPTRRILSEGGYEGGRATLWSATPAPVAETAEELVAEAVVRLVHRIRKRSSEQRF